MIGSLALGTFVVGVYSVALPHAVDIRASAENDGHVASAEKTAAWISAGAVSGLSILLRDPTMFTVGALTVIGLSWWYRHSNTVNPAVGRIGSILPDYNASEVSPDYLANVA
jgi:hypothetical protein